MFLCLEFESQTLLQEFLYAPVYEDKLDGKIDDEFWTRKMNEWREQERTLESQLSSLTAHVTADSVLSVKRVFRLANRAHFL